jgi:hypothetical protein
MPKTGLEKAIDEAVSEVTEFILDTVRGMSLKELLALRGEETIERPEQLETSEPKRKSKRESTPAAKPKKKVRPLCVYPGCTRNRLATCEGYCREHWRWWKTGQILGPEKYRVKMGGAAQDQPSAASRTAPGPKPKTEKKALQRLSRADKAKLLDRIVAYLEKNPDSNAPAVASAMELPSRKAGLYLKELRDEGRVTAKGRLVNMVYSVRR